MISLLLLWNLQATLGHQNLFINFEKVEQDDKKTADPGDDKITKAVGQTSSANNTTKTIVEDEEEEDGEHNFFGLQREAFDTEE